MSDADREQRPDPDALLARIEEERARALRGRLKVFFGASPGVGKTYAMLSDAQRLREQGRDVVVGIVETHGRAETERLVADLPVLPRRQVDYRGRTLEEFDLDAALARKPAVLLLDELAHTNAVGSRHPKRYQDVQELLAAGIDVHTTLNVQHLESLNDIIGGITGIRVRETLPDRVFDEADEIVLVDLTPDDLLQRLKEGKVYFSEQADRAIKNFFRKGNLLALRELALRRTADRVDTQMRSYRVEHVARAPVWKARDALLVGIGPKGGDEALVRSAARLAAALDARWHAVYVETPHLARLSDDRRRRVVATLRLAEELGATSAMLTAPDAAAALVDYARTHNLGKAILGRATAAGRLPGRWRRSPARRISLLAPDLDIVLIGREPAPGEVSGAAPAVSLSSSWHRYGGALAISGATALCAFPLQHRFDLSNIVMLFLLATVAVAILFGRGPAVVAAVVNVLAFDFFYVPPQFTFAVSDVQYVFTFVVMLVVGLVIGQLTAGMRHQARFASQTAERAQRMFEMARELSAALAPEQVADIGERFVGGTLPGKCVVQILNEDETLRAVQGGEHRPDVDMAVARWCVDHGEPAGLGTETLPAGGRLYLPLKAPVRTRGVLVVEPLDPALVLVPEQRRLLETCAALIAIALERVHFVSVAQRTLVDMESERLRNSVLSAISHDIRTPLTVLIGLSETLTHKVARGEAEADALAVRDQARRTAQLVDKLLDMARLEAGHVQLRKNWQSLEELIGSSLATLETPAAGRPVDVAVARDLPLVYCDGALIERVLVNLLENAIKYTPPAAEIRIGARRAGDAFEIAVEDRGPGLPSGREDAIFDKFTRGQPECVIPGVGLGLAICRAIVAAHGGEIRGENREGGGARFVFTLPYVTPPAIEPEPAHTVAAE